LRELDEIHARWIRWLGKPQSGGIWDDIIPMLASRQIWERYMEIVQANPAIQSPANFHQWVRVNYVVAQALAIRRQVDRDKRTVSLRRLMDEIIDRPEVVSRERYLSLYEEAGLGDIGAKDWERLVGSRDYLDPAEVEQDVADLVAASGPIRELVNKQIAHRDQQALRSDVTFNQLHTVIDMLAELYVKYVRLLSATSTSMKVAMDAWDEIFRHPWIEPETET
jgi:hypothetical protein